MLRYQAGFCAGQLAEPDLSTLLDVSRKLLDRLSPGAGPCHDQA